VWATEPSIDGIVTLFDPLSATLDTTGGTPGSFRVGLRDIGDAPELAAREVGQAVTVTSAGTLAFALVRLRRVGTVAGDLRVRIERCGADDGSNDLPDGTSLAVSAGVAASTVATSISGGTVVFTFTGGPALVSGARYAVILEADYTESSTAHCQLVVTHGDSYAGGGVLVYGTQVGWNIVAYPSISSLPFFFAADGITPKVAPVGDLVLVDAPAFASAGEWYDVADLTAQLQAWIDLPGYDPDGALAVQLYATPDCATGAQRRGQDFRLAVAWTAPPVVAPAPEPNREPLASWRRSGIGDAGLEGIGGAMERQRRERRARLQ
jgi:hypothetical protein